MRLKSIITVIALILIMFMSAIESSIISLALPTIKQDLNAGNLISLIFTAYFIALVIANPIVGELLSRFKIIYVAIAGLLLFSIGSFMCGLSTNFTMLIISRVIQGFGSGVLMSLSQIVPKLAFEIPLRYKIMGIVGSVWGISSIIGPLLGGGILEFATWHWLFYINIPIAIIAIILVIWTFHFPEEETVAKSKFDTKGLTLFYVFIGLIMFALLNQQLLLLNFLSFILAIVVAIRLFKVEKHVSSPFLPVVEFNRSITLVFITDLLTAICLMGFNLYIPVYLQEQLGLSPLQSGLVIFPLSVAWITLNFNLHRIEAKLSRKVIYLLSFTLLLVSSIIISFGIKLPLLIAFVLILAGLSFGYIYTKDSVIVQEETSPLQMKKMMSFYGLTKNLGASIGSTIMGYLYAIQSGIFGPNLHNVLSAVAVISIGLIVLWVVFFKEQSSQSKE
ncbi:TPA: MFS transporter [Staphylococcus aureus]|uniref:multidrug efflux MFS transporter SdrM n=2 Tax=Staphylococcus aureus TaxID=1280 RepID=UPI0001DDA09E|nr:multidrug efflux MFS transporter SdrM [Staphylococcus aureus]HDJ6918274.1 MFS transporter [Staphylococcus aureus Sa_TPS3169]HDJ6921110.1 MFS transporter [Staphylococcus aureus Sa_TPS3162]HDJ6929358.1 MFS transporter [Staphylococcus aureus Sa_TPS3157]HDJ6932080.1 MFS transporter [Staphylococcus aureus Sa_TPS3148]HDJ6937408.1 MFS transporter [Staphylococcus aureus Sa_TPS3161]HDJ6942985.1 MFS transporter [Staphylococcus aureus Sa_TPS3174]HDJ6948498.1 MFS transporter [Staphylococcus aureus Sa